MVYPPPHPASEPSASSQAGKRRLRAHPEFARRASEDPPRVKGEQGVQPRFSVGIRAGACGHDLAVACWQQVNHVARPWAVWHGGASRHDLPRNCRGAGRHQAIHPHGTSGLVREHHLHDASRGGWCRAGLFCEPAAVRAMAHTKRRIIGDYGRLQSSRIGEIGMLSDPVG